MKIYTRAQLPLQFKLNLRDRRIQTEKPLEVFHFPRNKNKLN